MERLFLAALPSTEASEALVRTQESLRDALRNSRIRWLSPEQFHFTIHFLGDVSEMESDLLIERLSKETYTAPFTLKLTEVGAFPSKKHPRVLWAGTTMPTELLALHGRTGRVISLFGLEGDPRPFAPHITLGNVGPQSEVILPENIHVEPVSFTVSRFALMKSVPGPEGCTYHVLHEFALNG